MEVYQPSLQLRDRVLRPTYQGPNKFHVVTDLEPNTAYTFRVRAQYSNGLGPWSQPRVCATLPETVAGRRGKCHTASAPVLKAGLARRAVEFTFTGGMQTFVIPTSGVYRIVACGAKAADGQSSRGGRCRRRSRGPCASRRWSLRGAIIAGDFVLRKDDRLVRRRCAVPLRIQPARRRSCAAGAPSGCPTGPTRAARAARS